MELIALICYMPSKTTVSTNRSFLLSFPTTFVMTLISDRILNLSVSSSSIRVVHDQKYMVTGIVDKRQFSKTKNKVYG